MNRPRLRENHVARIKQIIADAGGNAHVDYIAVEYNKPLAEPLQRSTIKSLLASAVARGEIAKAPGKNGFYSTASTVPNFQFRP